MKNLRTLFWEMFKIALTVVGGGLAILVVADEVFSKKLKWTEEGEIAGHLPVFQMVPGIIAGNTAVYVGRKVAGIPGAAAALAGVFLPSVIVFSAVSAGYAFIPLGNAVLDGLFLGLRAALAGIIVAMAVRSWRGCVPDAYSLCMAMLALAAIGPLRTNPAAVVGVAAALGVLRELAPRGRSGGGLRLFSSFWAFPLLFLKYGSIAFGGGYVLVPVYLADFVGPAAPFLQLTGREFADVMALTQMTPGPVAVNCATFFGYRLGVAQWGSAPAGVACAVAATLLLLLPGSVLLYLALGSLDRFRESRIVKGILAGVRPVTMAMMLNAVWAFSSMSAWTVADGGRVAWHPLAALAGAFAVWGVLSRKVGIVRLIVICALALAASAALGLPT